MSDENQRASHSEVVTAFNEYLTERADDGNQWAQAVTDIGIEDRVVTVTFDLTPTLIDLFPSENFARFPGTVIAFRNERCDYIRTGVDRVATQLTDGTSLGELTAAELYELATSEELPE